MSTTSASTTDKKNSNAAGITKKTSFYFADPKRILIQSGQDKRNTRCDFGKLEDDLGTMKITGWHRHQPALVKRIKGNPDFDFELIDGERRLTYCLSILGRYAHLFEDGIPIVIEDEKTTDAELIVRMMTSNHGKPFTPAEEMMAIEKLLKLPKANGKQMTLTDVAKMTGRSMPHLVTVTAAIKADDSVKDAIKDGTVPATLARRISVVAKGDKKKQKELIEKAKEASKTKGKAGQARMREVKQAVEDTQRRKLRDSTAKQKMSLSPQQIKELEAKMSKVCADALATLGTTSIEDFRSKISGDDLLAGAYQLGVAQALQAVLGHKVNLTA